MATDYIDLKIDMETDMPCRPETPTHDTDWIRKLISVTEARFHEYREELRRCEKQAEQLKDYMNQLKKLMNITKTSVYKMEAIINEEQS